MAKKRDFDQKNGQKYEILLLRNKNIYIYINANYWDNKSTKENVAGEVSD